MTTYVLGAVDGKLCARCSTKLDKAVMPVVAAITAEAKREEDRFLLKLEREKAAEEAEAERLRISSEVVEAEKRLEDLRIAHQQARRNRERLLKQARKLARDLAAKGLAADVARTRAAAHYGLRSSQLSLEERAA
jgi:hypothetical protein